jgi:hypothetical protein
MRKAFMTSAAETRALRHARMLDPLSDPRARHRGVDDEIDITPGQLREAMRATMRSVIAEVIQQETERTLARLRGRVD